MSPEDYEFLFQMEERYWWFIAMRKITDTVIGPSLRAGPLTILDAGCGTGYNMVHYQHLGHHVYGFDLATEAIVRTRRRGLNTVVQASVTEIPYREGHFDLVVSFEVIDEVPNGGDRQAFVELYRVLKPGGLAFVRLPAFDTLRSSHDVTFGTAHRFSRAELEAKLRMAGFRIETSAYANFFLLPIVAVRRVLKGLGVGKGSDTRPLPAALAWLDPVFRMVLSAEAGMIGRGIRFPVGLSAICLARKPADQTRSI